SVRELARFRHWTRDAVNLRPDRAPRLAQGLGHPARRSRALPGCRPAMTMSYGANFLDAFQRTAELIDKILRGVKPADIPVEQPTKFDLVINLTTAKALGLTVPDSLLARADEVIE